MKKIIDSMVDWESITGGRLDKEAFSYELGQGTFRKDTGVLDIPVTLNFVIPYEDLMIVKDQIRGRLPFVNEVNMRFSYQNVILTEDEIIREFYPYLIKMLEAASPGYARAVGEGEYSFDRDENDRFLLVIPCIGKTSEKSLNRDAAPAFERAIRRNFGLNVAGSRTTATPSRRAPTS